MYRGAKARGKTESAKKHSGAGRFTTLDMRTMSWQELGHSSGKISLKSLMEGGRVDIYDEATDLEFIIEKIITGGFPGLIKKSINQATDINRAYIVSLALAALGANKKSLLSDLKFTGFLFESLATHELRVYAQANDAKVYHYRDSSSLEVDAIVQKYSGEYAAFEIKLGTGQIDVAAANLTKFAAVIDTTKTQAPQSLNIITGTGISYTRADGINVISLSSLGV